MISLAVAYAMAYLLTDGTAPLETLFVTALLFIPLELTGAILYRTIKSSAVQKGRST